VSAAEAAGRAAQALELRKAGVPYALIAERLGYASEDAARGAVVPLLAEAITDESREAAALERLRLDGMLTGLWSKARGGDSRAIEQSLRIMERKRLLALSGGEEDGYDEGEDGTG
jgi:hypothetical protein